MYYKLTWSSTYFAKYLPNILEAVLEKYRISLLISSILQVYLEKYGLRKPSQESSSTVLGQVCTSPSILQVYFKQPCVSKRFPYSFAVYLKYTWRSTAPTNTLKDVLQRYLTKYVLRQVSSKYNSSSLTQVKNFHTYLQYTSSTLGEVRLPQTPSTTYFKGTWPSTYFAKYLPGILQAVLRK